MILALFSLIFGLLISINGAFTLGKIPMISYCLASVSLFLEMTMFAYAPKILHYWSYAAFTHMFYQIFTISPLIHMIYRGYKKSKSFIDILSLILLAMVLMALFSCVGSLFIVAFIASDARVTYWVNNVVSVYDLMAPCCYIIVSVIQIHKLWPVGKFYPDIRRRIIIQGVIATMEVIVLVVFNILNHYDSSEVLTVFVAVDLLMLWDSTILAVIVRDIIELANNSIKEFKGAADPTKPVSGTGTSSASAFSASVRTRDGNSSEGNSATSHSSETRALAFA